MGKENNYSKLIDFSNGKYSYNDYLKVKEWLNEAEKNKGLKEQLYIQWSEMVENEREGKKSLHHIFEKIQYNILLEEKKNSNRNIVWNIYRYAAAVLLIPMFAFSVWISISKSKTNNLSSQDIGVSWVEINAPHAARVEFLLPDSTKGWLNSGSKLKYPTVFKENRKVELSGEAFFEVKKQDQSEFIVSLENLDVKVLGTKFNVSAYAEDIFTDVVLSEGIVEVNGKKGVFKHTLMPNEKLSYDSQIKSAKLSMVDANRFSAWKDGFLIIDNEPLGKVVGRIERWYNAEIIIQDEALKSYRFKATFQDEPLEEVLRLLAITTPLKYNIEKRDVDSGGVLEKRRVIINLKK